MNNIFIHHHELIWPLALLCAWIIGELGEHWIKIPKIIFYILFGFFFAKNQIGIFPSFNYSGLLLLFNIAVGLVIFEFGYRINLRWLANNPIILLTSAVESIVTFLVVFAVTKFFGLSTIACLEFSALSMATSPVVIMYIVNYQKSSGQVTERILHLTALNSIFAIFAFKIIVGLLVFQVSGNLWQAVWASILLILLSSLIGIAFALFLSVVMKKVITFQDRTVAFALFVIVIVSVARSVSLSPVVATLAFALTSRYKRAAMGETQRNFGALGDILILILFVIVPLNVNWHDVTKWIWVSIAIFSSRLLTKTSVVALFSRYSGVSWPKSLLSGLALAPISVFSVLLLDQNQVIQLNLSQQLAVTSSLILFELIGPIITQYCLIRAKENSLS